MDRYSKEIEEGTAALFLGAGMSMSSGIVDWKTLVSPLASEIGLDISREHDFVGIAQHYLNHKQNNRSELTRIIIEQMSGMTTPSKNHLILAQLPISTYWTTNYDRLIEDAFKQVGKRADPKYCVQHLCTTSPKRDAVIYKMHGDIEHAHEVVLCKDDYETYERDRGAFSTALSGDLISKTFLFMGISFTDPNLDYILSRIRVGFKKHQRQHYCLQKKIKQSDFENEEEAHYHQIKQNLQIEDLKRFNIETILVDEYDQITEVLAEIQNRYKRKTVFVSGSASEYGQWGKSGVENFMKELGQSIVENGYRIASGIGLGIGAPLITGGIEAVYRGDKGSIDDYLQMKLFPLFIENPKEREVVWEKYRHDIIEKAGIAIFVYGNKLVKDEIVLADGLEKEFTIAQNKGLKLLPVGSTGFMAKELWLRVNNNFDSFYPDASETFKEAFSLLGEDQDDYKKVLSNVKNCLDLIMKGESDAKKSILQLPLQTR